MDVRQRPNQDQSRDYSSVWCVFVVQGPVQGSLFSFSRKNNDKQAATSKLNRVEHICNQLLPSKWKILRRKAGKEKNTDAQAQKSSDVKTESKAKNTDAQAQKSPDVKTGSKEKNTVAQAQTKPDVKTVSKEKSTDAQAQKSPDVKTGSKEKNDFTRRIPEEISEHECFQSKDSNIETFFVSTMSEVVLAHNENVKIRFSEKIGEFGKENAEVIQQDLTRIQAKTRIDFEAVHAEREGVWLALKLQRDHAYATLKQDLAEEERRRRKEWDTLWYAVHKGWENKTKEDIEYVVSERAKSISKLRSTFIDPTMSLGTWNPRQIFDERLPPKN